MIRRFLVHAVGATIVAFIAAGSTALAYPKSCIDVWLQHLPDGEYVIEPKPGMVFTVTCFNTQSYLTLPNAGGDSNFSEIAPGGIFFGTPVRTSFSKIRIDPNSLLVDIADLTFATSTGELHYAYYYMLSSVSYAVAGDCAGVGSALGRANVDLRGTPFEVKTVFATEGWNPAGSVNGVALAPNQFGEPSVGQVLNLTGGGYCGATGPDGFNSHTSSWLYSGEQGQPYVPTLALQLRYRGH